MSESTAGNGNPAPGQTVEQTPPDTEITDQLIQSIPLDRLIATHPDIKDLKEKHAAAETEATRWKGRAEKATKPEEKTPEKEVEKTDNFVTRDELWERDHAREIALAGDEYKTLVEKGLSREFALEHSLLKKGITTQNLGEHLRLAETASAPSGVDRTGTSDERTAAQKAMDDKMGITPEDRAKYGDRAKGMVTVVKG